MNEKKFYTFIDCNKCKSESGADYVNITTIVRLTRFQQKDVNGTKLVTARARISNQERLLSKVLDYDVKPDENGDVWVTVAFWGDKAERIEKYLGDRERADVVLVGSVNGKVFPREEGGEGYSITINAKNWTTAKKRED